MSNLTLAWEQAQDALARRDMPSAKLNLERVLQLAPQHCMARVLLAGVLLAEHKLRDACRHLVMASRSLPDDAGTVCKVAQALVSVGETVAARACLLHPAVATCRNGSTLASLAHIHQMLGQHAEALAMMDRAHASGFENADFRYFRAIQLQFNGRLEEAEQELEACLHLGPTYGRASLTLARLRKQTPSTQHLAFIRAQLARIEPGTEDHAGFEFAQYKELEDLGETSEAWDALERANSIMHGRLRHDSAREQALFGVLASTCDAHFLKPVDTLHEGPRPIFIVGMPRSGTTILDRILGNHSRVVSAGELSDFAHQLRHAADCPGRTLMDGRLLDRLEGLDFREVGRRYLSQTQWRAGDAACFVDKLPANFMIAGLIAKALPRAVVLHMARDPMDVCFSNYRALFGDAYAYSYDLASLAAHHRMYKRLMAHWHEVLPGRILDVDYQELVTSSETVARRVFEFCDLAYEPGCTDLPRNAAPSATLSSPQVRERVHTRGIGAWRRYERQLQPLASALLD